MPKTSADTLRAGLALGLLLSATNACSSTPQGQPDAGDSGVLGNGQVGTLTKAANGGDVSSPFDATPDPSGQSVYFTAISLSQGPGVFMAASAGATPSIVFAGDPFVSPFGIAITDDGKTLYVADPGAEGATDTGRIWVLSTSGGSPTALAGADGYKAKSLEIAYGQLYFTGTDPNGNVGAFSVALAGGSPIALATGAPMVDPSGITADKNGVVYVVDTIGDSNRAQVVSISKGVATVILPGIGCGYPAGIALAQDESAILVSGLDPIVGTDIVYRMDLGSKDVTTVSQGIDTFNESAGLHRAHGQDVYAWADSRANGGGTVFLLSK
jgi:DNA-binding beta-propeller fold protein YncE